MALVRSAHRTCLFARDALFRRAWIHSRALTLLPSAGLALLKARGIPVHAHKVVDRVDTVVEVTSTYKPPFIVEAELCTEDHTTGSFSSGLSRTRHVAANIPELENFANQMILRTFRGPTTRFGQVCRRVMVSEKISRKRERTVSIFVDQETLKPSIFLQKATNGLISSMKLLWKAVRSSNSEKQRKEDTGEWQTTVPFDTKDGLSQDDARSLAQELSLPDDQMDAGTRILMILCQVWSALDGSRFNINLATTKDDSGQVELCCTKAQMSFDPSAIKRQPELAAIFSTPEQESQIDPRSAQAYKVGMVYQKLDGDIACFGCSAVDATATSDVIIANGGKPANFLDANGQVTAQNVALGLRIIRGDKQVNAIFINCSGDTAQAESIAEGIVDSMAEQGRFRVPLVLCLQGANLGKAKQILADSHVDIPIMDNLQEAGRLVVSEARRWSSTPRLEKIRGTMNPGGPRRK